MTSFDFSEVLRHMVEVRASDVHLTAGSPPAIREKGRIEPMQGFPVLSGQETREVVYSILNDDQRKRFENHKQLDFAYAIPNVARFRVNCFFQRGSVSAAFRLVPQEIPALDSLGVPQVLRELAAKPRGFVLVTGPTGSGKSTTLAAMIDVINSERQDHILTIEDPIEFLHRHKRSIVNQREVGSDAEDFALGLRAALREDPDVILVGEMRDLETVSTALTAAETGHLVFATLHTQSTAQTVDRIIDVFPPQQQGQVRTQLSIALQGIVTQQLLPTADGMGRAVACEVLVPTPAIRNLIREGKTHQIYAAVQTSGAVGMQTMDADLVRLVRAGKITRSIAEQRASVPEELKRLLGGGLVEAPAALGGFGGGNGAPAPPTQAPPPQAPPTQAPPPQAPPTQAPPLQAPPTQAPPPQAPVAPAPPTQPETVPPPTYTQGG
jgi:twitching motility protein PilT